MFVLSSNMFELAFVLFFLAVALPIYYRLRFCPLAHVPGPPLAAISSLFLYAICYLGIEGSVIRGYHDKYKTEVVRISPNAISVADSDAIRDIYVADPNTLEAEAKAAIHFASRLMGRYNVSQAEVLAREGPSTQRQYTRESVVSMERVYGDKSKPARRYKGIRSKNSYSVGISEELCMMAEEEKVITRGSPGQESGRARLPSTMTLTIRCSWSRREWKTTAPMLPPALRIVAVKTASSPTSVEDEYDVNFRDLDEEISIKPEPLSSKASLGLYSTPPSPNP
ncbi:hypothetical protein BKA65DRAFT_568884 [Rhexocercosporidium sp. MPI-PUGE-AT-0058]|nr:hypothetical protein BKA65DRAFT_568884 [Rhexocercosporidium sp. MPI-PUGE-AT-0058]